MKNGRFTRDDFTGMKNMRLDLIEAIVDRANALLNQEREKWPVVYQTGTENEWWPNYTEGDTHQARLADVTPISERSDEHTEAL